MTTGAWYVEGRTLHLLLPNFQAAVRMDNLWEVLHQDPMFEILDAARYEFIPTKYTAEGSSQPLFPSFLGDETPHLVIEYQQFLSGPGE